MITFSEDKYFFRFSETDLYDKKSALGLMLDEIYQNHKRYQYIMYNNVAPDALRADKKHSRSKGRKNFKI